MYVFIILYKGPTDITLVYYYFRVNTVKYIVSVQVIFNASSTNSGVKIYMKILKFIQPFV